MTFAVASTFKKIFEKHLFAANIGLSFGLSGLGDQIEQRLEKKQGHAKKPQINWKRTLHMSTSFGLTSGFLCHFWYNYLDKALPGRGSGWWYRRLFLTRFCSVLVCITACLLVAGRLENQTASNLVSQTVQLGGGFTWLSGSSGLQHNLSTSTSSPPGSGCSMTTSSAWSMTPTPHTSSTTYQL
eukprot:TRINITY_DN6065_c0_g1_i3.p1 TRINITY_DN6065_c0_g1~~TRINITY_DN6065_c0_g1_i3.p1  ORF type:complete len:184 (+),score=33.21 TRINITY_DN6065_c0_g1_i3:175-726(+)